MSERLRRLNRVLTPLAPAITLLVLGLLVVQQWRQGGEQVAAAPSPVVGGVGEDLPEIVGPWVGQSWDAPASSRPMLRPVQHHGRVYENVETGRRLAVLLVQGADWHDLLGYVPGQWYADRGWQVVAEREVDWRIAGMVVPAMEWDLSGFGRRGPAGASLGEAGGQLVVTSFAVLPGGKLQRTLKAGTAAAGRDRQLARAAGLIQVAFPGDTPRQERQEAMNKLMRAVILSIQQEKAPETKHESG